MVEYEGCRGTAAVIGVLFVAISIAVGAVFWTIRDMSADRDATARARAEAQVAAAQFAAQAQQAVAEAEAQAEAAVAQAAVDHERVRTDAETEQLLARMDHELRLMRETQAEYEKRLTMLALALDAMDTDDQERLLALLDEPAAGLERYAPLVLLVPLAGIALLLALGAAVAVLRAWPWKGGAAKP